MEQTYEEAATEVLDILEHTAVEDVKKISPKFIEYLKLHSSKIYRSNLDHTQKLKDMNLKPKTRALICLIYREYLCDEDKKEEYDKKIAKAELEYQEKLQSKYNSYVLFKNKVKNEGKEIITVENKSPNFLQKILNKLIKLFKK